MTTRSELIFDKQLALINDQQIKTLVIECLESVPTIFWNAPASSTGKYHNGAENTIGGLVKHTKALVSFAQKLLCVGDNEDLLPNKDIIIASCLLHDCVKYGWTDETEWHEGIYTVSDHPSLAAKHVWLTGVKLGTYREKLQPIVDCIASHSGKWNKVVDRSTKEVLYEMRTPQSKLEWFVHSCDMLASMNNVEVHVD